MSQTLPVGTIIAWGANPDKTPIPRGWMLCDGKPKSRTLYAGLFGVIGDLWGVGDNVNTFNVPNLSGLFLRGVDHGTRNDPDAGERLDAQGTKIGDRVATFQNDDFRKHSHNLSSRVSAESGVNNDSGDTTTAVPRFGTIQVVTALPQPELPYHGNETRPKNATVEYLIYYGTRSDEPELTP